MQFFADLEAGRIDQALARTAPGFTWTVPGAPGSAFKLAGTYSAERFPAMLARVAAALPNGPRTQMTSVTETEQRVVLEGHVQARAHDGGDYDNRAVYVFDIDGSRILAVREYLDTLHAAAV